MNQKEWKIATQNKTANWNFYNKTRAILKQQIYNDETATVIHHLRDTEEQRSYNDIHYELWGHNEDGSFEYGKYVIFVSKKQHTMIHKVSSETRLKMSINSCWKDPERREKAEAKRQQAIAQRRLTHPPKVHKRLSNEERLAIYRSEEFRMKCRINALLFNGMSGKQHSNETLEKMKQAHTKYVPTEETNYKISDALKGRVCKGTHTNGVIQLNAQGEIINQFASIREAARQTNCKTNLIIAVCQGKRKHTGGFVWKYADA